MPNLAKASAHVPTSAGTEAGKYPSPGIKSIVFSLHQSVVKDKGDHPIPLMAKVVCSLAE